MKNVLIGLCAIGIGALILVSSGAAFQSNPSAATPQVVKIQGQVDGMWVTYKCDNPGGCTVYMQTFDDNGNPTPVQTEPLQKGETRRFSALEAPVQWMQNN